MISSTRRGECGLVLRQCVVQGAQLGHSSLALGNLKHFNLLTIKSASKWVC